MKTVQLCSEVNGGGCKNKVSARNGYICAAGHSKNKFKSKEDITQSILNISKISRSDKWDLGQNVQYRESQWELFQTDDGDVLGGLADNTTIEELLQLELLRKGEEVRNRLAKNIAVTESVQWELLASGESSSKVRLASNMAAVEPVQWALFETEEEHVQTRLSQNTSISKNLAIELAKKYIIPYGFTENKSIAELLKPDNLSLLNQYPGPFAAAYIYRLSNYPLREKAKARALLLHAFLIYEKNGGGQIEIVRKRILERYEGDQEVALILGGASQ